MATVGRAGFFGKVSLGAIYEWASQDELEFSVGQSTNGTNRSNQANLEYRYTRWQVAWGERIWEPFQVGVFLVDSLDGKHFFFTSPSNYPYSNYYDETTFRWGTEFGTSLLFPNNRLEVAYRVRLLDTGLVAVYNNAGRELQYYVSSAINLIYHF